MRLVFAGIVASMTLIQAVPVHACGDKLLMLGRGIRFQSKHTPRPASVLLYLPPTGSASAVSDPNLESALREAGHAVRAVTTNADLETALRGGEYDVVLTDVTAVSDVERAQGTVPNAVVLPAVYLVAPANQQQNKQQAKADREKASKTFSVVVGVPGRPGHYCAAVDKAMDLKLKRQKAAARQP